MALSAAEVFRDYVTDGIPSSGKFDPKKPEIRTLLGQYEQVIASFLASGGKVYTSKASLDTDLVHDAKTMAWVVGDATAANNGIYQKQGASGTGSWTRVADLPYSFIVAEDSGAGSPNAIQASSSLPISGSALVLLSVFEANTASPVTVSFNGGLPLTIKTNAGFDVAAGGLLGGMLVMGRASETTFRLASDQASAALLAQMEQLLSDTTAEISQIIDDAVTEFTTDTQDMRDQAEAFASAAAASATEAEMYAEMVGAAVYDFNFDSDPETPGYDWND